MNNNLASLFKNYILVFILSTQTFKKQSIHTSNHTSIHRFRNDSGETYRHRNRRAVTQTDTQENNHPYNHQDSQSDTQPYNHQDIHTNTRTNTQTNTHRHRRSSNREVWKTLHTIVHNVSYLVLFNLRPSTSYLFRLAARSHQGHFYTASDAVVATTMCTRYINILVMRFKNLFNYALHKSI